MMLRDALALKSAWWPMGIQVVLKRRFGRYRMESGHRAGIAKDVANDPEPNKTLPSA